MLSLFFNRIDSKSSDLRSLIESVVENDNWICPIRMDDNNCNNYYTISGAEIVMQAKDEFETDDLFFGILTHNMLHSIILFKSNFGHDDYVKEELVCECASAMLLCMMGMKKTINEDCVAYENLWRDKYFDGDYLVFEIANMVSIRLFNFLNILYKCSIKTIV